MAINRLSSRWTAIASFFAAVSRYRFRGSRPEKTKEKLDPEAIASPAIARAHPTIRCIVDRHTFKQQLRQSTGQLSPPSLPVVCSCSSRSYREHAVGQTSLCPLHGSVLNEMRGLG